MKTRGEITLKSVLRNAGYSEKAADKILNWYTFSKKSNALDAKRAAGSLKPE